MDATKDKLRAWRAWAQQELRDCVDFWLAHGIDHEHGGVYTCLDRTGQVYSTDKSVWMQGRRADGRVPHVHPRHRRTL